MQEQEQQKSSLQAAKSRLSPKRWLVLALYMLVFCVHTAIVVMFSPLAVLFEKVSSPFQSTQIAL